MHLAQRLDVVREQKRGAAHAGSGQRGLGACMATADHDHVKFLGVNHHSLTHSAQFADFNRGHGHLLQISCLIEP
jgi:hypothetical protein